MKLNGINSEARARTQAVIHELEASGEIQIFNAQISGLYHSKRGYWKPAQNEQRIMARQAWEAEKFIADQVTGKRTGSQFSRVPDAPGYLDAEQCEAYSRAFTEPVSVIAAAPGMGKTRTVAAIAGKACDLDYAVGIGAFMGRSANRARQELVKLGFDPDRLALGPGTLHSIFRIEPGSAKRYAPMDDLPAGIFIIDEAGTLSVSLLRAVLQRLPANWNLVLTGDPYQLASIDPGNVLADLIRSGRVPVTTLKGGPGGGYRSDVPDIIRAIKRIHGYQEQRQLPAAGQNFIIETVDRSYAASSSVGNYVLAAAEQAGCQPEQVLVITAQTQTTKAEPLTTTQTLNRALKVFFDRDHGGWETLQTGDRVYAQGGNAKHKEWIAPGVYEQRAYTGELGTITHISREGNVTVAWDDRPEMLSEYSAAETTQAKPGESLLGLAYAITIHKALGGEAPAVIFVADGNSSMLDNRLAYTAISRARSLVIVLDIDGGFAKAIKTPSSRRQTILADLISGKLAA